MRWYAELPGVRRRQVVADVVALAGLAAALWAGRAVQRLVGLAAGPGARVEDAGEAVGGVPGLGGVGAALVDAGRSHQEAVLRLGLWLGVGVALLGIAVVLLAHLPRRLAWAREAAAAARLRGRPDDLQLLAYRAVARRPLARLTAAVPDAGTALAAGDVRRLAALELAELGLRPPA